MKAQPQYNPADLKDHLGIWLWIENSEGKIFMLYHKKFDTWTIPLEKSDPGETLEEAIDRTGKEEVGITITNYAIIHSQTNEYQRDGHQVRVQASLVKVLSYEGEPQNQEPEKHPDSGWKDKAFVKKLKGSTDAVITLQKYL